MQLFVFKLGRKLYSSALNMARVLGVLLIIAGAVQNDGNSTMQVDRPHDVPDDQSGSAADGDSSSDDLTELRRVEWERAEEKYGLYRPDPGETVIVVHRQTSHKFAFAPVTWDDIPVDYNMLPEEILSDIAHWYNDIHAEWEQVTWWLCQVHDSSRSSSQPVLAVTNYVLVHEDDFLAADMRPHGLIELVFGEDLFVFPTFLPRWINLSILRSFLEPMVSRTHFGMTLHGSYNGDIIGHRLIRCVNGFFIRVHFLSTPFLLSELYHSAPLHAATLHTVTEYPSANDVRCSIVYIAGGYTLISSRIYERVDVHAKVVLTGGLHQRFPDLVDVNFDLVKVHGSISSLDPVVNHAKVHYVLAVIEEEPVESIVVLKLDMPPYVDIGAIFVPQTLTKNRLIIQTGIDMVCGPAGEVCACYHNGYELLSGEETIAYDGDFFACWLEAEPQKATSVAAEGNPAGSSASGWAPTVESNCSPPAADGVDNRQ